MVHIAGLGLTIEGRYMRQRCAWCGVVLLDYDLAAVASIDGSAPSLWTIGAQVEVNFQLSGLVPDEVLTNEACSVMEISR